MNLVFIVFAILATLPGLYLRLSGSHPAPALGAALFGLAILGAAFLISWTAEAAQMDIAGALAIAFLALITVLPEYSVDMTLAWNAAEDPIGCRDPVTAAALQAAGTTCFAPLAIANMTGGNRLLIGIGWALVVFVWWFRSRRTDLHLIGERRVEIFFLAVATVYSFTIPLKGEISMFDFMFLLLLFVAYLIVSARGENVEEPHFIGPAKSIAGLQTGVRRPALILLFLFCAAAIFASAEPFAESLVEVGATYGIDEFLLIQWIAPLASESPEMIVALLFAFRLQSNEAMGALISSKVNQWTLLIGTLPFVFSLGRSVLSGGLTIEGLHMDPRQVDEVFLTAAQSLFAVMVIMNLRISVLEAVMLFMLFMGQFLTPFWAPFLPDPLHTLFLGHEHTIFAWIYLGISVAMIASNPRRLNELVLGARMSWGRLIGRPFQPAADRATLPPQHPGH